ncbi:MAG: TolC family protein [Muribaculaceae bacterium]|nr:TolC family protein [Muribaculaceae bacterium]
MKKIIIILVLIFGWGNMSAAETDTLSLTLDGAIRLAHQNSPSAQSARNTFLSAYWNYRYYRANYLPSVTLTSSPYVNKEMNKITQSDGTAMFIRQDQFGADLTLKINQNISLTGGSFFLKSSLNRLDEFQHGTTAYSSQPLVIGYQQSLFGYNSLKWDRKIEPIRFREAKKQYAETLELISATACNQFFTLASAQNELEMARQNFASADTLYIMAKGRYEIGTITENEMLQLEINRLNEETNVMDAEINLREAQQSIRSFLGLDDYLEIGLTVPDSVPDFEVPLHNAMALALSNSPDPEYYNRIVRQCESNLAYANANARMKADLYVQFGLSQTGKDIGQSLSHLLHQEYASITLSVPILDWGRGRGKVKEAKSQLALAETTADQGMNDFKQNVEKLVMQFNMQARKVSIASLTSRRSTQRHSVAMKLFVMGRIGILDLMNAVNEKNVAKRSFIAAMRTYWSLYYTLRSMTAYDFEHNTEITNEELLLSK